MVWQTLASLLRAVNVIDVMGSSSVILKRNHLCSFLSSTTLESGASRKASEWGKRILGERELNERVWGGSSKVPPVADIALNFFSCIVLRVKARLIQRKAVYMTLTYLQSNEEKN